MKKNLYYPGREWAYRDGKPRILAEKRIENDNLNDYKFFCFNGEPYIVQVDIDRFSNHKHALYSVDWKKLDVSLCYPKYEYEVERTKCFAEMLDIAKKLSENLLFVRVDLYDDKGKVLFGELIFYPESGTGRFYPESYDYELGEKFNICM